jgi:glycosyltransferase involved in cell wall biosynthesis
MHGPHNQTVAAFLAANGALKSRLPESSRRPGAFGKTPVSVVVPCFNEEALLPSLAATLQSVQASLADEYDLHFVIVDDGSTDRTAELTASFFGPWPNCTLIRHRQNRGIAAAILTGIRAANTEIVCSVDADCTYDPHELAHMIPLLAGDVDLVTASPYHPQGHVANVPGWRLALSKVSSLLYRCVLRQKLFTYTSCFRVYRRSAVANTELTENGFQGVAEILARLDLQGSRIVEYPATLSVRQLGRSKMRIARAIGGHLRLLFRLLSSRLII